MDIMDRYVKRLIGNIKGCETDEDLSAVIDRIYSDGFADGYNAARGECDDEAEEPR